MIAVGIVLVVLGLIGWFVGFALHARTIFSPKDISANGIIIAAFGSVVSVVGLVLLVVGLVQQ